MRVLGNKWALNVIVVCQLLAKLALSVIVLYQLLAKYALSLCYVSYWQKGTECYCVSSVTGKKGTESYCLII